MNLKNENFDDNKSESGSTSEKSVAGIGNYDIQQCTEILARFGQGHKEEHADKMSKSLVDRLRGASLGDPRRGNTKMTDELHGRLIHEGVTNLIKLGDEPVMAVVMSNFNLGAHMQLLREKVNDVTLQITELEESFSDTLKPEESIFTKKANITIYEKKISLETESRAEYSKRVNKGSVSSGTRSKSIIDSKPRSDGKSIGDDEDLNETLDFTDFEDSIEYIKMNKKFELFTESVKMNYDKQFIAAYESYERATANTKETKSRIKELQTKLQSFKVQEILLQCIHSIISLILTKIKEVVQYNLELKRLLNMRVILYDGTSLVDPLSSDNLCGVYTILSREFNKATLVSFFNMLMSVMSEDCSSDICDRNPSVPIDTMTKHLKAWNAMNLYDYMDKDKLFTVLFLRSLPPNSELRTKSILAILEYLRKTENGEENNMNRSGMFSDMPVFTYLTAWIQDVYVAAQKLQHINNSNEEKYNKIKFNNNNSNTKFNNNNNNNNNSNTNNNNKSFNSRGFNSRSGSDNYHDTEIAASSFERKTGQDAATSYDRFVPREENVWHNAQSGNRYPYVASKTECNVCKIKGEKSHRPLCYNGQCVKCHLHGHKQEDCRQASRGGSTTASATTQGTT